jgi:hypothetical protein
MSCTICGRKAWRRINKPGIGGSLPIAKYICCNCLYDTNKDNIFDAINEYANDIRMSYYTQEEKEIITNYCLNLIRSRGLIATDIIITNFGKLRAKYPV